jgi:hypothetical protein
MQPRNSQTRPDIFPRLAAPQACGEQSRAGTRDPETPAYQRKPTTDLRQCECTHLSSFDAILDAYWRDPERWDGLS